MTIVHHETYESAADWFSHCEKLANRRPADSTLSQCVLDDPDRDFYGASYPDALKLSATGWQEGRDKMVEALVEALAVTMPKNGKFESLDVAGAYPIIPAYIAGAPDCMVVEGECERAVKPIVRFICEQWGSYGVNTKQLTNRGAAILAHIDSLEAQGFRCEIMARFSCSGTTKESMLDQCVVDILVKRADEPLEVDRIAFMLAHPATLRRFFFRQLETIPASEKFVSGHGMPPKESSRKIEFGDIFLPSANENTSQYDNPVEAAKHIGGLIKTGLETNTDCRCDFM